MMYTIYIETGKSIAAAIFERPTTISIRVGVDENDDVDNEAASFGCCFDLMRQLKWNAFWHL